MTLQNLIRDVPNFPKPGIVFKDITPLLNDAQGFKEAINRLSEPYRQAGIRSVCGIEARGFIFGAAVAQALGVGFVPMRKPGKLPWQCRSQEYALEYGTDKLEVHADAITKNDSVLIVDDVLATGGTAEAACKLIESIGGRVAGCAFLMELTFLNGRNKLAGRRIDSVLSY